MKTLPTRWCRSLAKLRCGLINEAGNATVELGLVFMVLVVLVMGAVDFGRLSMERSRVVSAAQAGSQFAFNAQSSSIALEDIVVAVRNDAEDLAEELAIDARQYCQCASGGGEVSCSSTCADGAFAPLYVEVSVGRDMALMFPYPFAEDSYSLSEVRTVRIR